MPENDEGFVIPDIEITGESLDLTIKDLCGGKLPDGYLGLGQDTEE